MKHYLGIDIGTFESKGVLADETGRIVASAARPHKMLVPQPGWAEHRPREDWWEDVAAITRKLLAESKVAPSSIRAVGTSAIGPCMLPVDGDGEPLMNGVLYGVDTRAAKEIEELTAGIGEAVLVERCGNALTSQSVGPKILWLKRNRPDIFAKTRKILTSTSYIVHRLTGRFVIDHYTAANTSPLYLADQLAYSDALSKEIVELDRLPEIAWTTDIAGTVTKQAAAETGLAAGTPVIVGTIDAAAEALSVGVLDPGDMMVMYGSTIFIIMRTASRVRDPRLWYAPWLFPGQHASMSGLATSGTLTHWFREQFAHELDPASSAPALAAEAAASPPGARGLVVLPHFSGERTPIHDPHAKGVVFGLNLTHTRGDVFRAFLEGIAFGTNHIMDTYLEAGAEPRTLFSVGGGTKNRVWAQATSDVSGRKQVIREKTIGASYGDAFLAALAVGDVRREDIRAWNPVGSEFVPDPATAEVYARQYGIYRDLYTQTRDLMRRLDGQGKMQITDFKALTFDCYGTLIDWESGMFAALQPLAARAKKRLTRDEVLAAHARHESSQQLVTPAMPYSRLLAMVHKRLAEEWGVPASFEEALAYGRSIRDWPAFPDSAEALRYLKQHYRLVILSNVDNESFAFSNQKLGVAFDAVYTAEDVGSYKPAPRNFTYMLDKLATLGLGKGDILHTAESLFHDHGPANEFGLASCWIHRRHDQGGFGATMNPGKEPRYDFRFTSMKALADEHRKLTGGR